MNKFVFYLLVLADIFEPIVMIIGAIIVIPILIVAIPFLLVLRFWYYLGKSIKHQKSRIWAIKELKSMSMQNDNQTKKKFDRKMERMGMLARTFPLKPYMTKDYL